jgi:acetylornithine/N-succinyldiaminopimelate aminotransferase
MSTSSISHSSSVTDSEKEHLFQNYAPRQPLVIERGEGCYVYDAEGKRYLDFVSGIGVNALGHGHPRIMKVMRAQMETLIHCSNLYYHPYQGPLAARLTKMSGLDRAFFANSGAESMEGALKIAKGFGRRQSPEKYEIIALNGSFGGRTLAAAAVTGQAKYREPFEPLIPGVKFVNPNDETALKAAVGERTTAIVFEPILGEGGIIEIQRSFAALAARLARQYNALLICDEIQSGMGRTGSYFAFQNWNLQGAGDPIQPDVITLAKPLGGGLPIGCILASDRAAEVLAGGLHGSTFGGNALACRVALEVLDLLDELLPSIQEKGDYFAGRLNELVAKHDLCQEVRGRGLMRGLKLNVPGKWVVAAALETGFLVNCTAESVIRFLPPYVIERHQIDELIGALDRILATGPPAS